MNLINAILLSLAAGFVIIAIHQTMVSGFANAYGMVMISVVLFFAYTYRKKR